ncbi:hypothetical protein PYK79_45120 [Streptomyces sp. ID05-04B]|uniref:hypothetical protein n=1 Tax=unclassified Streptomyces TaxID=2593676 RepID=UPI000D19AC5B|nr:MULTISPECIES: hypothetical protein [unclassified Streptomyces]AVV46427.1 hypothetical protein C6376_38820 [Streptomyces sp. P3]AVV46486.1 hypothetical protein C6376_39120 [Streptomyces sp. P3]MDX5569030.1 hypothetical protein [Streptomyces sp. ID05-04B]
MTGIERTPLQTIEGFEAAAFRAAHVARTLLAEHAALPLWEVRLSVYAHPRAEFMNAELEISVMDAEHVAAWAGALGTTAAVRFHDADEDSGAFEFHSAKVARDGVKVSVSGTRLLSADEQDPGPLHGDDAHWAARITLAETEATEQGTEDERGDAEGGAA